MNRFDFEQQLLECWSITKDIETLRSELLDGPEKLTPDELDNILLGMRAIYDLKFERLSRAFEQGVKEGKIT
jgi:hypothetical protein